MADYFLHYFSFVTSSINSLNGYDGLILASRGTEASLAGWSAGGSTVTDLAQDVVLAFLGMNQQQYTMYNFIKSAIPSG